MAGRVRPLVQDTNDLDEIIRDSIVDPTMLDGMHAQAGEKFVPGNSKIWVVS
jgi:hypothetical protein